MANINFDTWVSGLTAATSISGADAVPIVQSGVTKKIDPTLITPFTKDVNGNYIADIVPRTGTLASLLAVTNAGDGEIASATDFDAIVKYSGNAPSVGKPYYQSIHLGRMQVQFAAMTAIGSGAVLQLDPATLSIFGNLSKFSISINTTSSTNNYIDLTSVFATINSAAIVISGFIPWDAGAAFDGSYRGSLVQQGPASVAFSNTTRNRYPFTAASNILVNTPFFAKIDASSATQLIRIKGEHNATSNPNITASSGVNSGFISLDIYQTS